MEHPQQEKLIKALIIIIDHFNNRRGIPEESITWLINNKQVVYGYFLFYQNRNFATALLAALVNLRQSSEHEISIEDIMFACMIIALHRNIEDCLLIWEAKNTDFDTFCGVDIQLVPFMGVAATVAWLNNSDDPTAKRALEYIADCNDGGNFDELENYYSNDHLPWWLDS